MSEKNVDEDNLPENETDEVEQTDSEERKVSETIYTVEPDEETEPDEGTAVKVWPYYEPQDGDDMCTICGFLAKCPRALKIHTTRKHAKKTNKNTKSEEQPEQEGETPPDVSPAETSQEVGPGEENHIEVNENQESEQVSVLNEVISVARDHGIYTKGCSKRERAATKEQIAQEEENPIQERRVSKRIPKPKVIYSCNYCGQEFRDKPLLEVHIKRHHAKDTPYIFDVDEIMDEEDEAVVPANTPKTTPARTAPKRMLSRFHLKCASCEFRVSTPALLESHARLKHTGQDWYHCKLCHYYTATAEWMKLHLSSEIHQQREIGKTPPGKLPLFEDCVEKVNRDTARDSDSATMEEVAPPQGDGGEVALLLMEGDHEAEKAVEAAKTELTQGETLDDTQPAKKKRGRPKQVTTTTCGYCGLVVSNATNLTVHVRRKHSKDYGYNCTLCNYSCVTKGDMDRHRITKKHVKRAKESSTKNQVSTRTAAPAQKAEACPEDTDTDGESGPDNLGSKKNGAEDQSKSDSSPPKSKYDSVNACSHCDFVAHSIPSLHLHVKRKHTRDFEFVCLACNYYAVTTREMSRHASTDKHKQKSQKYLEPEGSAGQKMPQPPVAEAMKLEDEGGTDSNPDSDQVPSNNVQTEKPLSNPDDSQDIDAQSKTATTIPTLAVDAVAREDTAEAAINTGSVEAQAKTTTYSDGESKLTNQPIPPVTVSEQQPPEEDQSIEQGSLSEEDSTEVVSEVDLELADEREDGCFTDTQMFKALPFDACIVSVKTLAEQEQALLEGKVGEASIICLTGGESVLPSFLTPSAPSPHIKKVRSKEVKVKDETKIARVRCEDCGFLADGLSGLNVHTAMKHPSKEKHFHCMVCGKSFYMESNLHQHLTSAAHLRNEQNCVEELPEGGATFKCLKCTDRFETEQDLFLHIKEKHEELLREVNKYVLEDTEQINREREENQGSVCKYCGKVCKSSNSMAFLAHIRTHTGSKPFKCKICNFATAQLGDARNHVKRHLGMREYKCEICG
ncbi:zinc finger protein 407 [Lampris incognitus]|uniref:zinc finger protein 407 n=1 Tax=Lampris incognitus TaxID=2546036 RepID=UPI0024B60799|nr:zinc finger protein 407 [Lampris incognitus]